MNSTLGDWRKIIAGVSQRSILGSLLVNVFLNDICFFLKGAKIINYADDKKNFLYYLTGFMTTISS